MGKLTEMSTDQYSKNVAQQRLLQKYQSGNYDGGAKTANMINWGITTVFQIANSLASQDGSGDSDSSNISENDDKERKELNKELTKLLKELGLNSEKEINNYIESLKADDYNDQKISNISKAERASAIFVRLRELNATSDSKGDISSIYGSDATAAYDAKQELSDIQKFCAARDAFIASPTKDNAKALQDCVKNIDNPTVKNGYKCIEKRVKDILLQPDDISSLGNSTNLRYTQKVFY
mgnify:CR=1 FL=1